MKLNMFRATPPIIRSLKLHWQPLVFDTWKVVGRVVGRRCHAHCAWFFIRGRLLDVGLPDVSTSANQRRLVQF
jgi:hypothetical protein